MRHSFLKNYRLTITRHIWYTSCVNRTIRVQLHTTNEQAQALTETLEQFTHAFNQVCRYGWTHREKNGVALHHATYYQTKASCPLLVSDLLIQARTKATEAIKSALTWQAKKVASYPKKVEKAQKQGKPVPTFKPVQCPQSLLCPVRYNEKTYVLNWTSSTVRLSTTQGRMTISFSVPSYCVQYQGYPPCTADLLYKRGKFYLHIVVDIPEPDVQRTHTVIGVDLGLNRPAVTSTRQFLGKKHWKEIDRRYFRLKRKLQSNGSKSAKRHLKKLSRRQARFHRDCDHVLSKQIVTSAPVGSTIVLENLTTIRESSKMGRGKNNKTLSNKRKLHCWTFAPLSSFIGYKGQAKGVAVERVDPRHTSQTCSRCGFQHRYNRRSQSLFLCRQCHYSLNADLNASYNIRSKYLATFDTLLGSGLSVMKPLVSTGNSEEQAPAL